MPNEPLNKFQSAVTRTTAAIGVKTSVFVGNAKIKTHISTLKKEIASLTQDLGTTVFELWDKGVTDPERIGRQCRTIKEKYLNIETLNAEIEKLERQETEVLGSKTPQSNIPVENTVTYACPNCNSVFDAPKKFCRNCGTKME